MTSAHERHVAHLAHMKNVPNSALEKTLRQNYPELIPYLDIPELKTVLLNGVRQNWSDTNFRAAIYGTKWWQHNNAQQKQWLIATPADKQVILENAREKLAEQYKGIWGADLDPAQISPYWANRVAQGTSTLAQWVSAARKSQAYKDRYPGLVQLRKSGDFTMNEDQYRQLEDNYKQVFHQYGINGQHFDQPADFTSLFTNQIDPTELGQRLKDYRWLSQVGGQYVRDAFSKHANVQNLSDSDLYGILSGQRQDLIDHYNKQTGKNLSLADIEQSISQAQSENKAEFDTGGSVQNAPAAQPEKVPQQMQEAF